MKSLRRVPAQITTSASAASAFAARVPFTPMPPASHSPRYAPLPADVSATGIAQASASAASAASAAEWTTPPPATISGRRAPARTATAASSSAAAGGRRGTDQVRGAKNAAGQSYASPCRSWCSASVTAPAASGSSSTRIASGSAASSCSGRAMRSKKRLTGRRHSLTDQSA